MTHRPLVGITTFFAIGIFTNYLVEIPSFIVLPIIFLTIIVYTFLFIFHSRQSCLSPEDDPVGNPQIRLGVGRQPPEAPLGATSRSATGGIRLGENAAGPVRSGVLTLLILIFLTGILYHHFRSNSNSGNNISNIISTEKILIHLRGVVVSQSIDKFVPGLPLSSVVKHQQENVELFTAGRGRRMYLAGRNNSTHNYQDSVFRRFCA